MKIQSGSGLGVAQPLPVTTPFNATTIEMGTLYSHKQYKYIHAHTDKPLDEGLIEPGLRQAAATQTGQSRDR